MSITRGQAATYLDSQFDNLATEIGQTLRNDTAAAYGPDIDAALRRMGVAEAALATATADDDRRVVYYALCDYYCLRRMARLLATRVDSGALVNEGDRQLVFDNVMTMLAEATATVTALGYGPESDAGAANAGALWGYVDYNTDYVEPSGSASEYT